MRILVLFLCLFLFACNKNDNFDESVGLTVANLAGTWKLEKSKVSPGGLAEWTSVKNGSEFTFLENGTYTFIDKENTSGNQTGTFSVSTEGFGDVLSLSYQQNGEALTFDYFVTIGTKTMIIANSGCIEECSYGYRKIK